jgi:hypothetical protein
MQLRRFAIPILVFMSACVANAQVEGTRYPDLSATGYETLKKAVEKLESICPPPKCGIVFIGRSNVLMSAYLDAKGSTHHVSLPISGVGDVYHHPELSKIAKANFKKFVLKDQLSPKLKVWSKLIVVDYVHEGESLAMVSSWIKQYSGPKIAVKAVGYGDSFSTKPRELLAQNAIAHETIYAGGVRTSGEPASLAFFGLQENYSPYDSFRAERSVGKPTWKNSLRRSYPFRELDNVKRFHQYASYDDLVQAFKEVEAGEKKWEQFSPRSGSACNGVNAVQGIVSQFK